MSTFVPQRQRTEKCSQNPSKEIRISKTSEISGASNISQFLEKFQPHCVANVALF
jgi:hypothetical protein